MGDLFERPSRSPTVHPRARPLRLPADLSPSRAVDVFGTSKWLGQKILQESELTSWSRLSSHTGGQVTTLGMCNRDWEDVSFEAPADAASDKNKKGDSCMVIQTIVPRQHSAPNRVVRIKTTRVLVAVWKQM